MSTMLNTKYVSIRLELIKKKIISHISVSKLAIQKTIELEIFRNKISNEKIEKYTYQIIAAGLFVILIATLINTITWSRIV